MLFSDPTIAQYINDNFEPAWESVRKVPKITADLGDGKVVTKTFRGNIATYICNSDGNVIDVLPGLYTPSAYLTELTLLGHRGGAPASSRYNVAVSSTPTDALRSLLDGADIKASSDLSSDTDVNEHERRQLIHQTLAVMGPTTPQRLKTWMYKEVLHSDLNDPYLGARDFFLSN